MNNQVDVQMNEQELLSQMALSNSVNLNDLVILGLDDFDKKQQLEKYNVPLPLHETTLGFVCTNKTYKQDMQTTINVHI